MVETVTERPRIVPAALSLPQALRRLNQRRDPEAWDALLDHCGEDILRVTRRILHDEALAEDACQEALLQIRAHSESFKAPPSAADAHLAARVWIMRIAGNIAFRMQRSRARTQHRENRSVAAAPKVETATPAERQLNAEQSEILHREVAGLPDALREPILLRFFGELDYPALATALSCSPDAAKKRVQRGLSHLRTRLAVLGLALTLADLSSYLADGAVAHAAEAAAGTTVAASATHATAAGLKLSQPLAWKGLLNATLTPAFSGVMPVGGLTLVAKISLAAAALFFVGTGFAVVQHSRAEDPRPPKMEAAKPAPSTPPAVAVAVAKEEPWKQEIHKTLARKVSFEFIDTPLGDALSFLNSLAKVNIVLDPKAADAAKIPITLKVADMEMETALKWILRLADLNYDLRNQAVFISTKDTFVENAKAPAANAPAAEEEIWKKDIRKTLEKKVTFEFVDTPLDEAVAFIRTIANLTVIIDPKVVAEGPPPINLRVSDMSLANSLDWMTKLGGLEYQLKDNAIFITKAAGGPAPKNAKPPKVVPVKPAAPPAEF